MFWYLVQSSNNHFIGLQFGIDEAKPSPPITIDGKTILPSGDRQRTWYCWRITRIFLPAIRAQGDIPDR